MYSQSGMHQEIAHDRQQQVLKNARVDHRAVPHMAELAANGRADKALRRSGRVTTTATPGFGLGRFPGRLRRSLRPDLRGV